MLPTNVIAIFDVGKTNKKLLLFDQDYQLVHEESGQLAETTDEDGFPCEDAKALTAWLLDSFERIASDKRYLVKAVNFSAYGASFVYLDAGKKVLPPLYNYLKPFPAELQKKFYAAYGGEEKMARETASPVLGNLNSGLQLYRLKQERPDHFDRIRYALHLPQYLSYVLCSAIHSDITSLGCHTHLWDFDRQAYHRWVMEEGIDKKLPALLNCTAIAGYTAGRIPVGGGLHDSSAALIPYLASFTEPFTLLSTGTWCISLNPFNQTPLTGEELNQDCLCYLSYEGRAVKASRLFAGHEHEQQAKRLSAHFNKPADHFATVALDAGWLNNIKLAGKEKTTESSLVPVNGSLFSKRKPEDFSSYEQAYHQLISDIMQQQVHSTGLVLKGAGVKKIFVDGGFSKNAIYMHLLAAAFPGIEVYGASLAQATALGAAMAIHTHWNSRPLAAGIIDTRLQAAYAAFSQ